MSKMWCIESHMALFMAIKDFSKWKQGTNEWFFYFFLYYCTTLSSIMTQFRLHRCGRRGIWFFDDRGTVAYVQATARRVEGGHWITWWGWLKIDVHCRRDTLASRRGDARKGDKERKRKRREEKEGRSSNTHLARLPTNFRKTIQGWMKEWRSKYLSIF